MVDKIKHRLAGDPFRMAAGEFNMIADHVNAAGVAHIDSHPFRDKDQANPSLADVYAHAVINYRDVVALSNIGLPSPLGEVGDEWPNFVSAALAPIHLGKFGIAPEGAFDVDDLLPSVVHGLAFCKLYVPANGDFIDRADIDSTDATRLRAQLNGSAQILWKDTGTDATVDAIVRLSNPENVHVLGKANGIIPANGTGTVRVWRNGVDTSYDILDEAGATALVYHDWMDDDLDISADKELIATWFPYEGRWRVTHAECEDTGGGRVTTSAAISTTPMIRCWPIPGR